MSSVCSSTLIAVVLGTIVAAGAPAAPLRVCADPNNMPYSNRAQQGFENRLATMVARELHRPLAYYWFPQRRAFVRETLDAGQCDLIMGVPRQYGRVLPTRAYYSSSYAFVSRADRQLEIRSLDDPRLRTLTIGIQITGDDYENPPAAQALAARHIVNNVRGFSVYGDYSRPDPQRAIVDAVARSEVDLAIVWGPQAGFFAKHEPVKLRVDPIAAHRDGAALSFAFDIAMGVRRDAVALRDQLDDVIARDLPQIHQLLAEYRVPLQ